MAIYGSVRTSLGHGNFLSNFVISTLPTMDFDFQFDPTLNRTGLASHPTSMQVEELTLPDLMKNQHVQAMYKDWKDASNQVIEASRMQQTLWQENPRLNAEVNSLKDSHWQDLYTI